MIIQMNADGRADRQTDQRVDACGLKRQPAKQADKMDKYKQIDIYSLTVILLSREVYRKDWLLSVHVYASAYVREEEGGRWRHQMKECKC